MMLQFVKKYVYVNQVYRSKNKIVVNDYTQKSANMHKFVFTSLEYTISEGTREEPAQLEGIIRPEGCKCGLYQKQNRVEYQDMEQMDTVTLFYNAPVASLVKKVKKQLSQGSCCIFLIHFVAGQLELSFIIHVLIILCQPTRTAFYVPAVHTPKQYIPDFT